VSSNYGYIIGSALGFYFMQNFVLVIPVVKWRQKLGIKAPLLDPPDSVVKDLKISDDDLHTYRCVQRAHLNNVEFISHFLPLYLIAGAFPERTMSVFYAGLGVLGFRLFGGLGYPYGLRKYSGFFHLFEWYILWGLGCEAVKLCKA
jgi:hypothetical protein